MKLHLPKALLTAVLVACVAQDARAAISVNTTDKTYTVTGSGVQNVLDNSITFQYSDVNVWDYNYYFLIDNKGADTGRDFFNKDAKVTGSVQIGDLGDTADDTKGLVINNGNSGTGAGIDVEFAGTVTGNGIIRRTGPSNDATTYITFSGDMTGYKGNIYLGAASGNTFTFTLGGRNDAVTAATTTSTKGIAGTGNIQIAAANSKLVFNYLKGKDSAPVYITNTISETGSVTGSTVTLKGGADYIFSKNVTVDNVNLEAGSLSLNDCNNGTANVQSAIKVSGGAKLIAGGNDKLGWDSGATKSITLVGESTDKKAIFDLGGRQTLTTELHMDGYAEVTAYQHQNDTDDNQAGLNAYRKNGAIIDVTGTNNVISAALHTRDSFHITVAKDGELLVSGQVRNASSGPKDYDDNPNGYTPGSIVKLGEGKITFSHESNVFEQKYFHEAGETVIDAAGQNFKNGIKVSGGEFTLNADITLGSSQKIELTGGTLNLGGSLSNNQAVQFLTGTTGSGNITVKKGITLSNGATSLAKGKLTVEGVSLSMGGAKGDKINLSSFSSVDLNGATLNYHGANTTFNNVTVDATGATISINDMDGEGGKCDVMTLAGTTKLNGALNIKSSQWKYTVSIESLSGSGNLDISSSTEQNDFAVVNVGLDDYTGAITVTKNKGTATLNVTTGGAATLTGLTLKNGANMTLNGGNLTVDGNLEMSSASGITLDKDATINLGSTVSVKGVSSESTNKSQIVRITDAGGDSQVKDDTYSSQNTTFSIKNAHVTVSSATDINLSNKLDNSAITNNGTGTVNLVYGASDRTEVNALKGNINIMWMNDKNGRTHSLTKLEIGDNLIVAAQAEGKAIASITNLSTLKVTKTAIIGSNATVKANLTLTDDATLTLSGFGDNAATINGNLTLGAELKLAGEEFLEALGNLESGEMLKILNVEGAFSGLEANLSIAADAIIEEQPLIVGYTTSNYYSSLNVSDYALIFQGTELFIKNTAPIPEPTTATLSLLALAALAARRRRK